MGKRIPVQIGEKIFASKTEAIKFIRTILHKYPLNVPLAGADFTFVNDLLENHQNSDEKIGVGVASIIIEEDSVFGTTRHFSVIRLDGSKIDFSYDSAITSNRYEPIKLFKRAARRVVSNQIISFRDDFFEANADERGNVTCEVTGATIGKNDSHVDHAPPHTFDRIIGDFISINKLDLNSIKFAESEDGIGNKLADSYLEESFKHYHQKVAKLRVLSIKGNLEQKRQ